MRWWIGLAAKLYPRGWRERYGTEFSALLEDIRPGWREFRDVIRGAVLMRMTHGSTYLKIAGTLAVVGAIVAAAVSLSVPERYVSAAVLRITPRQVPEPPDDQGVIPRNLDNLTAIEQEVLTRASLADLIVQPSLDLYRNERQRMAFDEIIEKMRRDIRFQWLKRIAWNGQGSGVQISFSYPDRQKAQAVVQALTTRILQSNEIGNQVRVKVWRELGLLSVATPLGDSVEVLDAASLAEKASSPNRPMMIAFGLLAGLLLGLVAAFLKRRPKWTLQMAGFAAGGCGLAAGLSLLIADSYTSTAVVRITRPIIPAYLLGSPAPAPPAELFRQLQQRVLVRNTLQEIMQKPSLNLYPNERARRPLEEVIEKMRGDIHIDELNVAAVPGHPSAFQISFSYADRYKAQAVVDELITRFVKENLREVRAKWKESELDERAVIRIAHGTNGVEVLDPASLPRAASWPNRLSVSAVGLGFGLLLGALTLWCVRHRGQAWRSA